MLAKDTPLWDNKSLWDIFVIYKKENTMSNNTDWNGLGNEIREAVENALNTNDFSQMGARISNAVQDTLQDVRDSVASGIAGSPVNTPRNRTQEMANATRERKMNAQNASRYTGVNVQQAPRKARFRKVGAVKGGFLRAIGGMGSFFWGFMSIVSIAMAFDPEEAAAIPLMVLFGLLFAVHAGMVHFGRKIKKRIKRAQTYWELAGNNQYVNIGTISRFTGQKIKDIIKDIKEMIADGFFPEGHLDNQATCLILNNKVYNEYLELEAERARLGYGAVRTAQTETNPTAAPATELEKMIAEGKDYMERLRTMNDHIAGEEISAKLFRLENLLKQLFETVQDHPEQMSQMDKVMKYYLPTTIKLVSAYEEFDSVSDQGNDILEAKEEIEKTLDTINDSFVQLVNRMYRDSAFDVTTDAQVLKTMLAQEGLSGQSDFEQ